MRIDGVQGRSAISLGCSGTILKMLAVGPVLSMIADMLTRSFLGVFVTNMPISGHTPNRYDYLYIRDSVRSHWVA